MSPIFAFIAVLMLLSVGFALYKAVTAFSGTVESPRYESLPPGSVVQDTPYTILQEDVSEQTARLSDQDFFLVYSGSRDISQKVVDGSISAGDLVRYGMSAGEARRAIDRINRPSGEIAVTSDPDVSSAASSVDQRAAIQISTIEVPFGYSVKRTGSPYDGSILASWEAGGGEVRLVRLDVSWQSF